METKILTNKVNKEILIDWATKIHGFKLDRFNHLQKEQNGQIYRYKLQATSIRKEIKKTLSDGTNYWMLLWNDYYHNLVITTDLKLARRSDIKEIT